MNLFVFKIKNYIKMKKEFQMTQEEMDDIIAINVQGFVQYGNLKN